MTTSSNTRIYFGEAAGAYAAGRADGTAAERQRIIRLAESEAGKIRDNTDFDVNSIIAAALEDFAELLREAPGGP